MKVATRSLCVSYIALLLEGFKRGVVGSDNHEIAIRDSSEENASFKDGNDRSLQSSVKMVDIIGRRGVDNVEKI